MTTFALVLRSGGDYCMDDVNRLCEQIRANTFDAQILLLTDKAESKTAADVTVRLQFSWPGWWSKMELFAPHIRGDLLYMDLDTMVCGPLAMLEAQCENGVPLIMRDFNRPDGLQSSVMFIPEGLKRRVWQIWTRGPADFMEVFETGGDQLFLESWTRSRWALWPERLIVSYKLDCWVRGVIPKGARLVAFHGRPRPREIGWRLPPHEESA